MTARERMTIWRLDAVPGPTTQQSIEKALIAHAEAVKGEAVRILREYLAAYPETVFLPPPPGEHGRTVDGCSAAALRAVLPNIIKDVEAIEVA